MRLPPLASVGLALGLSAGAVFLGQRWLAEQRAGEGSVAVVVAARDLGFGEQLGPLDLREVKLPADAAPAGAFSSIEQMRLAEEQRSVLQPIAKNEAVLATRVTGPEQRATLSAVVSPGMRALSIRVNDVVGVGGFVLPNDRVDVILVRPLQGGNALDPTLVSDLLMQNVRVLGVDQIADASQDTPRVAKAVTLEVTPEQAQKLSLAAQSGTLTLALRTAGSNEDAEARPITERDLGAAPAATAAAAPARQARQVRVAERRRAPAPAVPTITIVRGEERSAVPVRLD